MGTGWLVHCAQQTQRIHENMVTRMLALHQDLNHTIRMLSDLDYWYFNFCRESRITSWYSRQIDLIAKARCNQLEFRDTIGAMAEIRRQFNNEIGPFWFPTLHLQDISRLRSMATGMPDVFSDVFFIEAQSPRMLPRDNASAADILQHQAPTYNIQDSVRIYTFVDDAVIFTQPPERVAAPEGGGASLDETLSTPPKIITSTRLPAPEGCSTEGLPSEEASKSGEPGTGPDHLDPAPPGDPDTRDALPGIYGPESGVRLRDWSPLYAIGPRATASRDARARATRPGEPAYPREAVLGSNGASGEGAD